MFYIHIYIHYHRTTKKEQRQPRPVQQSCLCFLKSFRMSILYRGIWNYRRNNREIFIHTDSISLTNGTALIRTALGKQTKHAIIIDRSLDRVDGHRDSVMAVGLWGNGQWSNNILKILPGNGHFYQKHCLSELTRGQRAICCLKGLDINLMFWFYHG